MKNFPAKEWYSRLNVFDFASLVLQRRSCAALSDTRKFREDRYRAFVVDAANSSDGPDAGGDCDDGSNTVDINYKDSSQTDEPEVLNKALPEVAEVHRPQHHNQLQHQQQGAVHGWPDSLTEASQPSTGRLNPMGRGPSAQAAAAEYRTQGGQLLGQPEDQGNGGGLGLRENTSTAADKQTHPKEVMGEEEEEGQQQQQLDFVERLRDEVPPGTHEGTV